MTREPIPDPSELMDATAAAHWLKVAPRTLHRWIAERKLRCWKVGGRRRVLRAEVELMIRPLPVRTPGPAVQTRAQVRRETEEVMNRVWPGLHPRGA